MILAGSPKSYLFFFVKFIPMKIRVWVALAILPILASYRVLGQTTGERAATLDRMLNVARADYEQSRLGLDELALRLGVPVVQRTAEGVIQLVGADRNGFPIFLATDNAGAAITTGVDKLRSGGGLGLNLLGDGIRVTIWDGGKVSDHIEFAGRMQLNEGSTDDNHATHVMGTIGAEGINPSARGMAPRALLSAWDFDNDLAEMISQARPDASGTILSNHSYDQVSGWRFANNQWTWFGDASVSTQEDWKFGFYGPLARSWDELTFNSPFYTIVKSAGNDRTDVGNGSRPADCNGGSGYDCIGVRAVAKNIITVGAVRKVLNYQEPGNVQMSSFSSWGPTDDGRIKPDLVAAGVDIFSTSGVGINQYTTLSGTSMSAPNVTGSLALLQQLYGNLNNRQVMRASTLKALAIHTTKEAGPFPGPDYSYGWGLLDVGAAASVLLERDNQNVFVIEDTLRPNATYTLRLQPQAGKKITATLVWTDPPGNPPPVSLDPTTRALVNDLNLLIQNDAGGTVLPWVLNPDDPTAQAGRGVNNRDNVEKIEFDSPEPRDYTLNVSHAGNITGPHQVFSLVVTYSSLQNPRPRLFWVGNSGEWNNPANWSASSGGNPANRTPTIDDRVIFDENSFAAAGSTVTLVAPAECHSLTVLTGQDVNFNFQQNQLRIGGSLIVTASRLVATTPGSVLFSGAAVEDAQVIAPNADLSRVRMEFSGVGASWTIRSNLNLGELIVAGGRVEIGAHTITTRVLSLEGAANRAVILNDTRFMAVEQALFAPENLTLLETNARLNLIGSSAENRGLLRVNGMRLPFQVETQGFVRLAGAGTYRRLVVNGSADLVGSNTFEDLTVREGGALSLSGGTVQNLSRNTILESTAANPVRLSSSGKAVLEFNGHYKLCFDQLRISNVDLAGTAVINAGPNSVLVSSGNWFAMPCGDVLFPDFSFAFNCQNGLTLFQDASSGLFDSRRWNFSALGTSEAANPRFQFTQPGLATVTLTLTKSGVSRSFSRIVEVQPNDLPVNEILFSVPSFFSTATAPSYQWFKNMEPIVGATNRSFVWDGEPGQFFVLISNATCNRPSNTLVITGTDRESADISVYPNPSTGIIFVKAPEGSNLFLRDLFGSLLWSAKAGRGVLESPHLERSSGVLLLEVHHGAGKEFFKVVIVK
jgi:hypothetical protein